MSTLLQKPMDFSIQHCEPCQAGSTPLTPDEAEIWLTALTGWELDDGSVTLNKPFKFRNFVLALAFVNEVGAVAEKEGHHPDVSLGWGYVNIKLQTHAIHGLHRNDFILASKIDKLQLRA